MNSFGPLGTIWDRLGQCWAIAIVICLSHSHLESFGVIWSHLEPLGAIWSQLTVPDGTQGASKVIQILQKKCIYCYIVLSQLVLSP